MATRKVKQEFRLAIHTIISKAHADHGYIGSTDARRAINGLHDQAQRALGMDSEFFTFIELLGDTVGSGAVTASPHLQQSSPLCVVAYDISPEGEQYACSLRQGRPSGYPDLRLRPVGNIPYIPGTIVQFHPEAQLQRINMTSQHRRVGEAITAVIHELPEFGIIQGDISDLPFSYAHPSAKDKKWTEINERGEHFVRMYQLDGRQHVVGRIPDRGYVQTYLGVPPSHISLLTKRELSIRKAGWESMNPALETVLRSI